MAKFMITSHDVLLSSEYEMKSLERLLKAAVS